MQEALLSPVRSALELKPFAFGDQRLASSPRYFPSGDDALYRCSSPFSPTFGFSSPSPLATSYQEVADRYELCLSHLAEAAEEAAALRRENAELRVANSDLTRRLALLSGKHTAAVAVADEIRRLRLGEQKVATTNKEPTPEKLAVLPKSISVRSTSYLKLNQQAQATATAAAHNRKPRTSSNPTNNPSSQQRAYDGVRKGDEQKEQCADAAAELEVYNQGMFKTELCNKWEETGACPYGDQCQFAHGVAELRPVIRHPRYKTAVCRMVLAGDVCPYGHRCHFRHSLTPAERLLRRP
uniref:C3H1-type domain-containing protein n=1 Tax=Oryza brachyantha TaxID=4533 RepID=J3L2B2_ORYBR